MKIPCPEADDVFDLQAWVVKPVAVSHNPKGPCTPVTLIIPCATMPLIYMPFP